MFAVRWLGIVFALIAGLATSQLPEFAQQYRQRLGGAIDELTRLLADFDLDARNSNLTRAQGIAKLQEGKDAFVRQRGRRIAESEIRLANLVEQRKNFETAGSFNRILVMGRNYDAGIAARAWSDFEPAAPVTAEGLVSAAVGFVAGLGLWRIIAWPFRRRQKVRISDAGGLSR